ncbi:uncharacterized protein LOC125189814 [Salvia hispanica]|uniref:uncharacterized protein LOC125189814 n=1 Tax=Salvia hispanica TaxID=49212 RepID=UPI00200927E9|nr:uncharacterized protein LOC125189814 [Salvia hispanica]
MEVEIAATQANFEADPSAANRTIINKSIATYILLLKMEEDFWRQKAAMRWLAEGGDKNTKFYQSWVKQKSVCLRIHKIQANGRELIDDLENKSSAVEFFKDLLAPDAPVLAEMDPDLIRPLPHSTRLETLSDPPDADEVKRASIGADVIEAVQQFFNGAFLSRRITATSIVLIPKKALPETWADYHPISFCNVSNKIITKILTARTTPLLPLVISPNQSGFVKGQLLNDNVLLAQEMFHELYRCCPAPNVANKIDMAKAYERVQRSFLLQVLRHMGFTEAWLSLIERSIGSCWFSVLINGAPSGFIKSTRGLRQGDPISPALFVIAAEYLSKALDKVILGKRDMTFKAARRCMEINHLAYADDIIIFTQAATPALRQLRTCLTNYEAVSGQQISLAKRNFYIAEEHAGWATTIQLEGGFSLGSFPSLYLGVPIYRGAKRTEMFMFLHEKIANRISGWAHHHLSFGERLTLIKGTLEAVPIHIFHAIEPTVSALKQLDQLMACFFWGSTNERKRTHWISWDQICLPTAEGGLGIRKFKEVLRAFTIKLW